MSTPAGRLTSTFLSWTSATGSAPYCQLLPSQSDTLTFNGNSNVTVQLKNVTDPVLPQDAATKYYVDSLSQGLSWHQACNLYSSTSINLASAPFTFDTVAPTSGARILINAQTNVTQNGIYIWGTAGTPMYRAVDFPTGGSLQPTTGINYSGTAVFILQGTTYQDTAWVETYDTGFIGTTTVTFVQFSATGGSATGDAAGQIQFRGATAGQFAASSQYTFVDSGTLSTLTLSATTEASTMNFTGGSVANGSTISVTTSAITYTGFAASTVSLFNTSAGSVSLSTGAAALTVGGTGNSVFTGSATTLSSSGGVAIGSSGSGNVDINAGSNLINLNSATNTLTGATANTLSAPTNNLTAATINNLTGPTNSLNTTVTNNLTSVLNQLNSGTGGTTITATTSTGHLVIVPGSQVGNQDSNIGSAFEIKAQTYTMNNNAITITTRFVFNSIAPSLLGSTTSTTTSEAINLYVGAPIAATSQTITNKYAIYADGNVGVNGLLTATSLSVTAPISFNNLTVTSLTVNGPSSLNGPASIVGPLTVTSNATFSSLNATSVSISGPLVGSTGSFTGLSASTLSVSGVANIVGPLTVTSNATFGTLSATSAYITTLVGNSGAFNGLSATSLGVTGLANITGPLTVTSNATFGTLSATSAYITTLVGSTGDFGGLSTTSLGVTGLANITGPLTVTSNATFGTLSATSAYITTLVGDSGAFNGLSATSLGVSGPVNLVGPLTVTSNATFGTFNATSGVIGNLSVTSLTITAPVNFTNLTVTTLNVTGPTTLSGTVSVVGPLSVTSNATFGSLSATSAVITTLVGTSGAFTGGLSATTLGVSGNATFGSLFATSAVVGTLSVSTLIGGAAAPAQAIQFNNGNNNFAGTSNFTWTTATNTLVAGSTSGTVVIGGTLTGVANATTAAIISTASTLFTIDGASTVPVSLFPSIGATTIGIGATGTTTIVNGTTDSTSNTTGALQVRGGIGAVGSVYALEFNATSDVHKKTDLKPIEDPLGMIRKMEGYSYKWKETIDGYNDKPQMGFVAQQLEDVGLDFLVTTSGDGSKSVGYLKVIAAVVECIKELDSKLEAYKNMKIE